MIHSVDIARVTAAPRKEIDEETLRWAEEVVKAHIRRRKRTFWQCLFPWPIKIVRR